MTVTSTRPKNELAELQWDQRNPSDINFLRPNGFRFLIQMLPKVTYFVQTANIPDITLGVATQRTPFYDMPHPGEKLEYGNLSLKFMIQETMGDYYELYNWMIGLGFPNTHQEFIDFVGSQAYRFPIVNKNAEGPQLSDATLLVLGSNNTPIAQFFYYDCFPVSLTSLEFDSTVENPEYFQATVDFKFRHFNFESLV